MNSFRLHADVPLILHQPDCTTHILDASIVGPGRRVQANRDDRSNQNDDMQA